jgi:hypothetical protein
VTFAAVCACAMSSVTPIGPAYPPRPDDCKVRVFPSTTPSYTWEDVATTQVKCPMNRTLCIRQLEKNACRSGADTVYGFHEGMQGDFVVISATIAKRTGDETGPPRSSSEAPAALSDPPAARPASPIWQDEGQQVLRSVRAEVVECLTESDRMPSLTLEVQVMGDGSAIFFDASPLPSGEATRCLRELIQTLRFRVTNADPVTITSLPFER